MTNSTTARIKELGLVFPPAPKPAGVYRPILVVDKFLYVSGQGPIQNDGSLIIRIPRCSASEVLEESLKTDSFHKMIKLSSVEYLDGSASRIIY